MDPWFYLVRDCLREFNYPKIQTMDDVEIMEIFSKTNRHFLVGWSFKQLDEEYCQIVEKASSEELGDLLCSNGFCSISDKDKFMDGECDVSQQVTIIFKMFQYLRSISDSKQIADDIPSVSFSEVETLLQFDTNLFSTYGTKQSINLTEQREIFRKYRKEIENIKKLIGVNKGTNIEINPDLKDQLKIVIESLDTNVLPFTGKILDTMKNSDPTDTSKIIFHEDFGEMLEKSSEYIKIILKFIKSLNVIMNFKEIDAELKDTLNNNNIMLRELSELCNEITSLGKDNL